jgi:hypothetical protein
LAAFVCRSTQAPLHIDSVAEQVPVTQALLWQISPPPQAWSQPPQ